MTTAIFPGTFNPFTIGHEDIVHRALKIFDKVVIVIGVNFEKADTKQSVESRLNNIRDIFARTPRVEVAARQGLTAEAVKEFGATAILRSVRSVKDYEYERDMADANRSLFGVETVVLMSRPELSYISSSLVRELQSHGCIVSHLLPDVSYNQHDK